MGSRDGELGVIGLLVWSLIVATGYASGHPYLGLALASLTVLTMLAGARLVSKRRARREA